MICLAPIPVEVGPGIETMAPCGYCGPCDRERKRAKTGRLIAEAYDWGESQALTLTVAPENEPASSQDFVDSVRRWVRSREKFTQRQGRKCKIDWVVEKGDLNGRIHAHAITFGFRFEVPNNTRFSDNSWPFGMLHALNPTPEIFAYSAGHSNKAKAQPVFRSRTQLGHGLMRRLAKSYASYTNPPPVTPSWRLALPGAKPRSYPWTPHMLRTFQRYVLECGGQYPEPDYSRIAKSHRDRQMFPDLWNALLLENWHSSVMHEKKLVEKMKARRTRL